MFMIYDFIWCQKSLFPKSFTTIPTECRFRNCDLNSYSSIRKSKDYVYGIWVYKALGVWKGYYRVKKNHWFHTWKREQRQEIINIWNICWDMINSSSHSSSDKYVWCRDSVFVWCDIYMLSRPGLIGPGKLWPWRLVTVKYSVSQLHMRSSKIAIICIGSYSDGRDLVNDQSIYFQTIDIQHIE